MVIMLFIRPCYDWLYERFMHPKRKEYTWPSWVEEKRKEDISKLFELEYPELPKKEDSDYNARY